ncbi:MAG TPA: hypothetical protein VK726_03465 [Acetobacteraceae bacterium]|jgi:hypothetical protein|nr:hypothetical protein [Acetobacteraceae bacterium]
MSDPCRKRSCDRADVGNQLFLHIGVDVDAMVALLAEMNVRKVNEDCRHFPLVNAVRTHLPT